MQDLDSLEMHMVFVRLDVEKNLGKQIDELIPCVAAAMMSLDSYPA